MPEYKPARFRRMLAWFLDLGICLMLPGRLVTSLPLSATVQIFAAAFAIFGGFAAFLCRDYLLGGRSIGKRIFGLSVVDRQTGEAVTGGRLVLRNLFLFLCIGKRIFGLPVHHAQTKNALADAPSAQQIVPA